MLNDIDSQDASLIRLPRAYAPHVQAGLQGCALSWRWWRTLLNSIFRARSRQTVNFPHQLSCRRYRWYQGKCCPTKGHAPQILPWVCFYDCEICPIVDLRSEDVLELCTTSPHLLSVLSCTRSSETVTWRNVLTSVLSMFVIQNAVKNFWTGWRATTKHMLLPRPAAVSEILPRRFRILTETISTSEFETHSYSPSGSTHCFNCSKRSSNDGSRSLRDNDLDIFLRTAVHCLPTLLLYAHATCQKKTCIQSCLGSWFSGQ